MMIPADTNIDQIVSPDHPEVQSLVEDCMSSLEVTGRTLFPDRFHRQFTQIHRQIFRLLEDPNNQKIAIAAPRGLGKTTLNNMLLPAYSILFQTANYIVPVSMSATHAELQSENLKYELAHNDYIEKLFGSIQSKQRENKWNAQQWVTSSGICVMPRGAGQQIRGILFRGHRPDLFIVDDLEDPDERDSEKVREDKKRWFYADLMKAVDKYSDDWRIIVLGTMVHEKSLLAELVDSKHWVSERFEICDENLHTKIPEWWDDEDIRAEYDEHADQGNLDIFYREFRNLPVATEDASFKQEYFRYYDKTEGDLDRDPYIENVVLVDIARTTKPHSTESAVVGVGVDIKNSRFYIRDIVAYKMHPDELHREILDMAGRLNAQVVGIEVTGLHEHITYPLKNEMIRRRCNADLVELQARGGVNEKGKDARIKTLIPFYRRGEIFHNPSACTALEQQLLSFPASARKDIADALGYLPALLNEGERYFAPSGIEEYPTEDEMEREMKKVMHEDYEPIDFDEMPAPNIYGDKIYA